MSIDLDHPFQPGARCAYKPGHSDNYEQERFVEKVYKTGHFVLRGDPGRRWRPSSYREHGTGTIRWSARPAGEDYTRARILFWDEVTDAEIRKAIAEQARHKRWIELRRRIDRLRQDDLTDVMLDAIEAALPPIEKAKPAHQSNDDRTEANPTGGPS